MKLLKRAGNEQIPVAGPARTLDWLGVVPGTTRYSGRNHPRLGSWLIERFCPPEGICADPMIGPACLWFTPPIRFGKLYGCDVNPEAVELARGNMRHNDDIEHADAEVWVPRPGAVDFVLFSPPYPQSHGSGETEYQKTLREQRHMFAMQGFAYPDPDMPKVYNQIRKYCTGRMVVILRNRILKGEETDWVEQNLALMHDAGWKEEQILWRDLVRPTGYQAWKLAKNPDLPWIKTEWVLVMRP